MDFVRHFEKHSIVIVTKLHNISHSSLECKYFLGMHDVPINIHPLSEIIQCSFYNSNNAMYFNHTCDENE